MEYSGYSMRVTCGLYNQSNCPNPAETNACTGTRLFPGNYSGCCMGTTEKGGFCIMNGDINVG